MCLPVFCTLLRLFCAQINDGKNPPWYLRAEDERQRKLWVLRLSYALAIVKWVSCCPSVAVTDDSAAADGNKTLARGRFRRIVLLFGADFSVGVSNCSDTATL
jgi:hypothetical protein